MPSAGFFSGIAASQADDDLYVDLKGTSIVVLSPRCVPAPGTQTQGSCTPIETFGEGVLTEAAGIAVDSADGTLYTADTASGEVDAFGVSLEADVDPATEVEATTSTAHGTVDPKSTPVTRCTFQYGPTTTYGEEVPCLNVAGERVGTVAHPITTSTAVHGALTGLASGSVAHFRLRVANADSEFLSSEDGELTTKVLATVVTAAAGEITAESATLQASVNPHGLAISSCTFEYGTDASYGQGIPCNPSSIPPGTATVPVTAQLTGLSPDVTYHFRAVLTDANGTFESPDHTFVFLTGSSIDADCGNATLRAEDNSTLLPDCRAYELVTPAQKNGSYIGALFSGNIPAAIASDGATLIAPAIQCFADSQSCVGTRITQGEPFEFTRTETGWTPRALALPATRFETSSSWRYNADTGAALFIAPGASAGLQDWYVHNPDGTITDIGPLWEEGVDTSLRGLEPEPSAATSNFSRLVYESQGSWWPSLDASEGNAHSLYEYPGPSGPAPELVGVSGGRGSHDLISTCGTELPRGLPYNALSSDGRTLYFHVEPCAHGSGVNATRAVPTGEIFARIDGERTVAISQPNALSPVPPNPACTSAECLVHTTQKASFRGAQFEGASADGSRVFFASPQQLTDDATQDPNTADTGGACLQTIGHGGCNLYLYEDPQQQPLTGLHLIDVSAGDTSGIGPELQGVIAISSDGTHVYFVAQGVLTAEPNRRGQAAAEGADNLYLYERDPAHPQGRLAYVTTLSPADQANWASVANTQGLGQANVTPSGRFLVFTSHRGLTADAAPGEGASQVYRYDADTGELNRISIGTRGFNDDGNAGLPCGAGCGASIVNAGRTNQLRTSPARPDPTMSDDGSRVFFKSPVALTPGALDDVAAGNDGRLAQNIYEWEAPGAEAAGHVACGEPGGCVFLISDGRDVAEGSKLVQGNVELFGTDVTGDNVFFATADRLTWQDTDTQRDYYDARVGGGFARPPAGSPCEGDACKAAGTRPGGESSPATSTFSGPGNVTPKPCHKKKKGHGCKAPRRHKQHKKRHRRNAHEPKRGHKHGHRHQGGKHQ
ncbi:MAG TPA: hypothetical protein VMF55_13820 [Solirubrobacterales bacterium]|nr:hypothetical protein [Solirubrobacterales bacterium]